MTAGFVLGGIVQLPVVPFALKHPLNGAPLGIEFDLAGPEHPARENYEWERTRAIRRELQETGRYELAERAFATLKGDAIDRLVACTTGWRGVKDAQGVEVPFSAENCRAVYSDPALAWARDQVKEALDSRELFITSSAPA